MTEQSLKYVEIISMKSSYFLDFKMFLCGLFLEHLCVSCGAFAHCMNI